VETGLNTDVVALDVEVSEADGDAVLRRRDDQPDAVLVRRVDARIERARYRAVRPVDVSAASVCTVQRSRVTLHMQLILRKNH